MKKTHYIGKFIDSEGHTYTLSVDCFGLIQAFFLLTADAIRTGNHYQLSIISDDKNNVVKVGDILLVGKLLTS